MWIDPKDPEPNPTWDIPIDAGLRGGAELRRHLGVTEDMFLFAAGHAMADARGYIVYTALDEVKKASMYLMRLREFLDKTTINPKQGRLERLLQSQLVEEQAARERRLIEVLLVLCLFEKTNEHAYFKHFLLLESLDDLLGSNLDNAEFYGARSGNIDDSIHLHHQWITQLEPSVDIKKCWYLGARAPIKPIGSLRPGALLSNTRGRLKEALADMTDNERLVVGLTYADGYGRTSKSVHFRATPSFVAQSAGLEKRGILSISLLLLAILRRSYELLGQPDAPYVKRIVKQLERADPTEVVHNLTVRSAEVGDFVLAYGDLAEVVEVRDTAYGYRSYKVSYLAERPLPTLQEDWFPARYVQRFYTRAEFYKTLDEQIEAGMLPAEVRVGFERMPPEVAQDIIRRSMVSTWNQGLGAWVRAKGDVGDDNGESNSG